MISNLLLALSIAAISCGGVIIHHDNHVQRANDDALGYSFNVLYNEYVYSAVNKTFILGDGNLNNNNGDYYMDYYCENYYDDLVESPSTNYGKNAYDNNNFKIQNGYDINLTYYYDSVFNAVVVNAWYKNRSFVVNNNNMFVSNYTHYVNCMYGNAITPVTKWDVNMQQLSICSVNDKTLFFGIVNPSVNYFGGTTDSPVTGSTLGPHYTCLSFICDVGNNPRPKVAFNLGWVFNLETPYENGYVFGYGNGYNAGYRDGTGVGYQNGYADGLAVSSGSNSAVRNLFGVIADTPIKFLKDMFSFELFGMNVAVVILSCLTAIVVFTLIKKLWK